MNRRWIGAATAAALIACASSASAALMDVVFTGTVLFGVDTAGLFGGGTLTGDAFSIGIRFDTTKGYLNTTPTANYAIGGGFLGNDSPALYATVTINGVPMAFNPTTWYGAIEGCNNGGCTDSSPSEQIYSAKLTNPAMAMTVGVTVTGDAGALPASITDPFAYTVPVGDMTGYFEIDEAVGGTGVFASFQSEAGALGTVTLSPAPVPEPATWAMMLTGMLGLGLVGARRRRLL